MYAVQKAEKSANIYIYGDIVKDVWFDGEESAKSIADKIGELGDVERIDVHIDSYGGAVSEGWAIYNSLLKTNAKIRTYADGFVASAAVFPFLAGDERIASSLSAFFLHKAWTCAEGNADELRNAADEVEKMTEIGINAFVERAGMNAETVRQMMEQETWLSGQEAWNYGIATAVEKATPEKYGQSARKEIIERLLAKEEPEEKPEETPVEDAPKSIFNKFKNSLRKENAK